LGETSTLKVRQYSLWKLYAPRNFFSNSKKIVTTAHTAEAYSRYMRDVFGIIWKYRRLGLAQPGRMGKCPAIPQGASLNVCYAACSFDYNGRQAAGTVPRNGILPGQLFEGVSNT
jgi:hypothetical protein